MKTPHFARRAYFAGAVLALAAFAAPAFGDAKTDLARELTGLVFPREKLIQTIAHQFSEDTRTSALGAMQRHFDYSRVERAVVPIYTATFSADELRRIVAFHKTAAGRAVQAATEHGPTAQKLPARPESPPADTHATRLAQAERLTTVMMTKELTLDALRNLLAHQPAAKRQEVLAQTEQLFNDPVQLRQLRLVRARQFVPLMTTEELRQVVAFYSTPAGRKLLQHNVRIGQAATEAAMREAVRVSEVAVEDAQRELRGVIQGQQNR